MVRNLIKKIALTGHTSPYFLVFSIKNNKIQPVGMFNTYDQARDAVDWEDLGQWGTALEIRVNEYFVTALAGDASYLFSFR